MAGNPPGHIAQLFKEVITQEFNGCYKHITFAIYGMKRSSGIHVAGTLARRFPSLTPVCKHDRRPQRAKQAQPRGQPLAVSEGIRAAAAFATRP